MVLFFLFPTLADAHVVMGGDRGETMKNIKIVENYFKNNFNLTLHRDVAVINVGSVKEYADLLKYFKINNAEEIAQKSGAVTSRNSVIVINTAGTDKSDRLFLLAHEMTHQYQFQQKGKAATEDMAMLEGFADLIANDISGAYISIENYGIKREDLKSYSDFNEAQKQYGNKVYEQARYYARKEKFLDYY